MTTHELIYFILLAFVNSLIIIGWNKATYYEYLKKDGENTLRKMRTGVYENEIPKESKMIFWKLKFWSLRYIGEFWSKPLFTCPTCMASVHSTYIYWPAIILFTPLSLSLLSITFIYPLYILMLAGMVTIINNYA